MSELEPQEQKQEEIQPVVAPQAAEQATAEQPAGLSRDQENVLWNLGVLDPGDYKLLAQVLRDHPEMRDQIIARASGDLGNDTVAKALALLAGVQEPEAPSEQATAEAPAAAAPEQKQESFDYTTSPLALEYDQNAKVKDHVDYMQAHPGVADQVLAQTAELDVNLALQVAAEFDGQGRQPEAPAQQEETPPQVVEETSKKAADEVKQESKTEEPAATLAAQDVAEARPAAPAEHESGWVVRAREFNAEHADEVAQFLAATGGACMVDGALDPNLVAQWQSRHGVDVDGRIGTGTVAAAIKRQPQTYEEAAKEAQEEQLPEPDPTDPRFAL